MQDHLREIEGTLARTSQRKNTILYKLAKRRAEEERLAQLGITKVPPSPHNVKDINVIKFVLHRLKQEIGDKIARMRNSAFISIEKDGETLVRARNDEINKLIAQKDQWERRLAILKNESWTNPVSTKLFFGCAKDLPEAADSRAKRERSVDAESVHSSLPRSRSRSSSPEEFETSEFSIKKSYFENVSWLLSPELEEKLLESERESEMKSRHSTSVAASPPQFRSVEGTRYISSFSCSDLPDESHFEQLAVAKRKLGLKRRLESLKKKI